MRCLSRTRLASSVFLILGIAGGLQLRAAAPSEISPLEPASTGGLKALDRALVRLQTHRRLLVIAAHPDDEDTALLTWVARGLGGEAAYLSLSRGDGGQNLIGPELGIGLGLLRSRELESARRIDGARQFFTRAYDFGYTRSLEETLERWPERVLLEDAMRIVRRFKPQVLVAIFPPTAAAGHGQHQASGLIAERVFALSADDRAFPELDATGLPPWEISSFYRSVWWDPDAATLELPLGQIEPFTGRSILQLALASRSQHRCQDMGSVQPLGDATGRLAWVAGAGGPDGDDLFQGVDTRLQAIAELLAEGQPRRETAARLARVADVARAARGAAHAGNAGAAEPLLEAVRLLRAVDQDLAELRDPGARHVRELVTEKLEAAYEGLAAAARVAVDAVTERRTVVPGETIAVRSIFWNAGSLPASGLEVTVESPEGWRLAGSAPATPVSSRFATRPSDERALDVAVPPDATGLPYFLRRPRNGDLYDWSGAAPELRGEPFGPPPLSVRFAFTLAGVPVTLEREVVYRRGDQAAGEVRKPLEVAPALEIAVEPRTVVWPTGATARETLRVEVTSNVERTVRARLEVETPGGWPAIEPLTIELDPSRHRRLAEVALEAPADLAPGRYEISLAVSDAAGRRFDLALGRVDYPHVRPAAMPLPATVEVAAGDIRLPRLSRIGYVRGASDRLPELLRRIGLPVELLTADDLGDLDLAPFDAIVVGSRAYEVDPALVRSSSRLLDYAREGGLVIVQYQQYQFVRGGFAPFPLEIHRPHGRVTDETAPVTMLEPEHPALTRPNPIGEADWQGWVQERGLYFAGTWDDAYRPLLQMSDPVGEEQRGALLVAPLGRGHYVYTGLAFFRQLPAGVVGAYRLFANLLALGQPADDPGDST